MFIPSVLFRRREWLDSLFLTCGFTLVFWGRVLGNWWGKEGKGAEKRIRKVLRWKSEILPFQSHRIVGTRSCARSGIIISTFVYASSWSRRRRTAGFGIAAEDTACYYWDGIGAVCDDDLGWGWGREDAVST